MCTKKNPLVTSNAAPSAKGTPQKEFVTIASFNSFNKRRFGDPWICLMTDRGEYDFSKKVGTYSGTRHTGEAGDLVVFEPVDGQVYGYGQKDYRGNGTIVKYAKWNAEQERFIPCTKLGGPRTCKSYYNSCSNIVYKGDEYDG